MATGQGQRLRARTWAVRLAPAGVAVPDVLDVQQPGRGGGRRHGHVHEERQGRADFAGADDVAVPNELDVAVVVKPDLEDVVGGVVA